MTVLRKNKAFLVISIVLSVILSRAVLGFFSVNGTYLEIAAIPLALCLAAAFYRLSKVKIGLLSAIFCTVYSLFFALSFSVGGKINVFGEIPFESFKAEDIYYFLVFAIVFSAAVINLQDIVCKGEIFTSHAPASKKIWALSFGFILICWLPYLLLGYPGLLSPDSLSSVSQALGEMPYSNHHPILFTLFVKLFVGLGTKIGGYSFGVACFSLAQMTVLAATLGYSVFWLKKKGLPTYLVAAVALFYALNPVIAIYSLTMWKDILFGGWMLLLVLQLWDIAESKGELLKKPLPLICLSVTVILVSFARNNGFYIAAAVLVILAVLFVKYWKTFLPVALSLILSVAVIQGPVYDALGIKAGNFAESVGIPLQQIGYTVAEGGELTEAQREFVNKLLPEETMKESYQPVSPDFIKFHEDFDNEYLNNNKLEFLINWATIMPKNFKFYVKAWLMQTVGYYHIPTNHWVIYPQIEENTYGIEQVNLIARLFGQEAAEDSFAGVKTFVKSPLAMSLYSIALWVWLTFFACAVLLIKKRYRQLIALSPLILLWGTMMVAVPTFCEFRYMFSFHLALPFIILFMLMGKREEVIE